MDIRPLAGGHRNIVLRAGGHILKTSRRTEAALRWLLPVQEAARAAGLVVPALLESTSGSLIVDGWTCEPFQSGTSPSRLPTSLRPMVAAMHEATRHLSQRPGFAAASDLPGSDRHGDVDMDALPDRVAGLLRDALADLPDAPHAAIHADLNPANLIETAEGRYALIDWDEARRDAPAFDLAAFAQEPPSYALAWEVACSWTLEPEHARRILAQLSSLPKYANFEDHPKC